MSIYLCDRCHRLLEPFETRMTSVTGIGALRIPRPHLDADGKQCSGHDAEVIEPWEPLHDRDER